MTNCSVTLFEFFSTKQNTNHGTIEWMEQELAVETEDDIECFTCDYTVGDSDNVSLTTPQKSKQMSFLEEIWQERKRIKQISLHVSLHQMMRIMLLCILHNNQKRCL